MTLFGTRFHYGPVAQTFHWAMAVLVAGAWLTAGDASIALHETIGVTVFVMVGFRLLWRSFDRLPGKPPMRNALARLSWLADILLYALLVAVPITGLIGLQELPAIAAGLHPEHGVIDLHRLFGNLIILIAGVHSVLALYHHFVRKDGVLRMMLPGGRAA